MMAENVRVQVEFSTCRLLIAVDLLLLHKVPWRPLNYNYIEAKKLVTRNVKLWRCARRLIFKQYNEEKKEQRRAKRNLSRPR